MIYFDSAATTFQKPRTVADAMRDAMATMSSPGRGGYPAAMRAAEAAFDCRTELAELYHLENPEQVAFTMNATHGLNIAIKSLVPPGGKAVISGYEHNAVTRPLAALGAQVSVAAAPLFQPAAVTAAFDRLIVPGMLTLDMTALGAAFIAMPGHKGLYGPQGTGVLLCGKDVPVRTLLEGGTGSISIQQEMPDFLPDRLEAGTHNMPGIAGLLAGVRFVRQLGPEAICAGERQLTFQAAEGLRRLPGLQVFALPDLAAQAGVLSIVPERMDAEALGAALADRGIAVRAGLHCAPLAHRTAGTLDTGTVRLSFSHWNTREEVSRFLVAMGEILR